MKKLLPRVIVVMAFDIGSPREMLYGNLSYKVIELHNGKSRRSN
jgi:hypothetical protein